MDRIRPSAVAGSFYPSDAEELGAILEQCFVSSPLGPRGAKSPSSSLIGGMVPHAGYIYSGPCAAHFYARVDDSVRQIILLGVNHRGSGRRAALSPWDYWQTPLGQVTVDQELADLLQARVDFLKKDDVAHLREHSIEVQLPFLQRRLTDFTFLPISLSHLSAEECSRLGRAVAEVYSTRRSRTLILASSDLNHYLSPEETERLDRIAVEQVLALNADELLRVVEEENISMCGVLPTAVLLFALNTLGGTHARLLKHCHSGDATPMKEVVGYASVAFDTEHDSLAFARRLI